MKIISAELVSSVTDLRQLPAVRLPELAVAGRSNAGKSSFINMLVGGRKIARISSTPGKTQTLNHYLINNSWYLVDLPGYGFATTSATRRKQWNELMRQYLKSRLSLFVVFLLVDVRIPPQERDLEFISFLGREQIPLAIVFNKSDKLSSAVLHQQVNVYLSRLSQQWDPLPTHFIASARTGQGRTAILQWIATRMSNSLQHPVRIV
jgi:GTP-binding protein